MFNIPHFCCVLETIVVFSHLAVKVQQSGFNMKRCSKAETVQMSCDAPRLEAKRIPSSHFRA